ncbi:hypothetical protein GCM10007383_06340 [Arenibacter certesii]|uniref:Uncharacterized protein n=1 Tax=Arenibacter certesii TaxID=228955 RepID=A0A918INN8_9FLAO|nr:hypothetical protein GCM10007383_06340 [Arenibacter certesii]
MGTIYSYDSYPFKLISKAITEVLFSPKFLSLQQSMTELAKRKKKKRRFYNLMMLIILAIIITSAIVLNYKA